MKQNDRNTETACSGSFRRDHIPSTGRDSDRGSKQIPALVLLVGFALLITGPANAEERQGSKKWAACWTSAMEGAYAYIPPIPPTNPYHIYAINPDLRFAFPNAADGAVEQTFRLIIKPDLFGEEYRLRFSNLFGRQPLSLKAISVAVQDYAGNIIPGTLREVTFNGAADVTIQPGKQTYSELHATSDLG